VSIQEQYDKHPWQPGDYFVVRTTGFFGFLIRLFTRSQYNHAGGILDAAGTTMEAKPGGIDYGSVFDYEGCLIKWGHPLCPTPEQRAQLVDVYVKLKGRKYNFLDIASLAMVRLHIRLKWIRDVVARTSNLICSQEVDLANETVGLHLFQDGRLPQDVVPGDLADLLPEPR
jgi:hypothetical protein